MSGIVSLDIAARMWSKRLNFGPKGQDPDLVSRVSECAHKFCNSTIGLFALLLLLFAYLAIAPAYALEPVSVSRDDTAIDLSGAVEFHLQQGESVRISTARGIL